MPFSLFFTLPASVAASEKIFPGLHGSCELPVTIGELRRNLHLHLSQD